MPRRNGALLLAACLAAVLIGGLGAGCRRRQPPASSQPPRPPRDVGTAVIRTPLACVMADGSAMLLDGDGNNQRRLSAPGRAIPESLSWSPDGKKLAYWTVDTAEDPLAGPFRLCVADAASDHPPAVIYTSPPGLGGDAPEFASDGGTIYASVYGGRDDAGRRAGGLFAQEFTDSRGVLKIPVGGGEAQPMIQPPVSRGPLRWLDLSPDGKLLVGISGPDVAHGVLALADLTQGKVLEKRNLPALYARWCPQALGVAFFAPREHGRRDLRLWAPGQTSSRMLVEDLSPQATFAWGPDGKAVAYSNEGVYAIQRDNHGRWVQTNRQETKEALYRWPTWSPDGRAVVIEYRAPWLTASVLKRDGQDPSVTAKDLLTGAERPLFAP